MVWIAGAWMIGTGCESLSARWVTSRVGGKQLDLMSVCKRAVKWGEERLEKTLVIQWLTFTKVLKTITAES